MPVFRLMWVLLSLPWLCFWLSVNARLRRRANACGPKPSLLLLNAVALFFLDLLCGQALLCFFRDFLPINSTNKSSHLTIKRATPSTTAVYFYRYYPFLCPPTPHCPILSRHLLNSSMNCRHGDLPMLYALISLLSASERIATPPAFPLLVRL